MHSVRQLILFVSLVLFIAAEGQAQVNIERMRLTDLDFVAGTVGGSFALRAGNVEFYSLGVNGRIDVTRGRNDAFLVGRVNIIQNDDRVLSYTRFGHARYNFDIKTWWQYELFAQVEFDEIRLLNQRLLVGTGLRFKIFQSENSSIHFGTTPMVEIERLNPSKVPVHPNTTFTRWSNYLSWRAVRNDFFSVVQTIYVQPRFDKPRDVRLLNDTSIDFRIFSNLSLGIVMNLRYDSGPPTVIKDFDLTLANTLKYSF